MKMDKVAGSGNDEFYTPEYAITPLYKYLPPPPFRQISNTVRASGRGSTDHHCWDLLTCRCEAE